MEGGRKSQEGDRGEISMQLDDSSCDCFRAMGVICKGDLRQPLPRETSPDSGA